MTLTLQYTACAIVNSAFSGTGADCRSRHACKDVQWLTSPRADKLQAIEAFVEAAPPTLARSAHRTKPAVGFCSVILAATAAAAPPVDTSPSLQEVTVIGKLDAHTLNREIRQFVQSHAAPSAMIGQVGRWREAICHPIQAWYMTGTRSLGYLPPLRCNLGCTPPNDGMGKAGFPTATTPFITGLQVDSDETAGGPGGFGATGSAVDHFSHGIRSEFLHVLVIADSNDR